MDKMKALDKEGRDEVAAILDPNISYKNQVNYFNTYVNDITFCDNFLFKRSEYKCKSINKIVIIFFAKLLKYRILL